MLHSLVNGSPVMFIHLIELINQTDSFVGQNKCSRLKYPFVASEILFDTCCETDSRSSLTSCIDTPVEGLLDALEELGLGSSRVSDHEDIDIPSNLVGALSNLLHSSEHSQ